MTDARARDENADGGEPDARVQMAERIASTSGPLEVVAADTFGWIHPDVAERPLTRRERRPHLTRLGVVAVVLSAAGLFVSWFGPWGAAFGLIGAVLGAVALVRRSQKRRWCWAAIAAGLVSILFSAYWLTWILPQLTPATGG